MGKKVRTGDVGYDNPTQEFSDHCHIPFPLLRAYSQHESFPEGLQQRFGPWGVEGPSTKARKSNTRGKLGLRSDPETNEVHLPDPCPSKTNNLAEGEEQWDSLEETWEAETDHAIGSFWQANLSHSSVQRSTLAVYPYARSRNRNWTHLKNIRNISRFARDTESRTLLPSITTTYASAVNPVQVWT